MKILFLTPEYGAIGGVGKHVMKIAEELTNNGYQITVLTFQKCKVQNSKAKAVFSRNSRQAVQIKNLNIKNNLSKFKIWREMWRQRKLIKEADIVHAHDVAFWYWPFRFLYPKKKFYITFHGWEGVCPPRFGAILSRKFSEWLSSNGSICVGSYLRRWYHCNCRYVTYGGVDKIFKQTKNSKPKIVFVGRLVKENCIEEYIKLLKNYKNYEIVWVGDGPMKELCERYGKVTGWVGEVEVKKYLQQANIVFASSYLAILEARAFKKQIISLANNLLKKDYLTSLPKEYCATWKEVVKTYKLLWFGLESTS